MNESIAEMRELYGRTATYALAYGSGEPVTSKHLKGNPRIVKKKYKKLHSLFLEAPIWFGNDFAETHILKGKFKRGCCKGKTFNKVFIVKGRTVYCNVVKHRHSDGTTTNTFKNLTWV